MCVYVCVHVCVWMCGEGYYSEGYVWGVTVCVGCVCVYVIMHVRVYECTRVCVCAEM